MGYLSNSDYVMFLIFFSTLVQSYEQKRRFESFTHEAPYISPSVGIGFGNFTNINARFVKLTPNSKEYHLTIKERNSQTDQRCSCEFNFLAKPNTSIKIK
jgi:hypothetical protein